MIIFERDGQAFSFKKDVNVCNFKNLKNDIFFFIAPVIKETLDARLGKADFFIPCVRCQLFTNVHEAKESYISLKLSLLLWDAPSRLQWSSVVSIVNIDGHPKYLQSRAVDKEFCPELPFQKEPIPSIHYEIFIKRSLLLNNEDENLPNGTLTLRFDMEISYKTEPSEAFSWALKEGHLSFRKERGKDLIYVLNLNSCLFRVLCEESECFNNMPDGPSQETWLDIKHDSIHTFADMLYFLERKNLDHLQDMPSLLNLYDLADKYGVNNLIIQTRNLIIKSLEVINVAYALVLASKCLDKEMVNSCLKYIKSLSSAEQCEINKDLKRMEKDHLIAGLFRGS